MTVIDCVKSPPVDAMGSAGVTGLCRYLSWADQRDTLGKVIHGPEYDALRAAGFDILLNGEYGARDWLGGASLATVQAKEWARQAHALGYPTGCSIPSSADLDMTYTEWVNGGRAYAVEYRNVMRGEGFLEGVYGPWDVLGWCRDIGYAGTFWQSMSTAYSGGRNAQLWPGAHLHQRRSGFVGGFDVDFNDVIQANYGQAVADMTPEEHAEIIEGDLTDENVLHWRLRAIQDQYDPLLATVKSGRPSVPGLKQISEQIAALGAKLAAPAPVDTHALATDIAQQLVAATTNGLTQADLSAVRAVVVGVLNNSTLHTS